MSYIASTSSSGQSARQYPQTFVANILGRVDIPVVNRAAMSARPRPHIERHAFADRTATRASLRAWEPSTALYKSLTGTRGFVFQKVRQHVPTNVGDSPSEIVVLKHPLHIEVFNGDDLVFVDDSSRKFVKVVFAGARNALMRAGDQLPSFVPTVRSFLLAGQRLLLSFEVPLPPFADGEDCRTWSHCW